MVRVQYQVLTCHIHINKTISWRSKISVTVNGPTAFLSLRMSNGSKGFLLLIPWASCSNPLFWDTPVTLANYINLLVKLVNYPPFHGPMIFWGLIV